MSEILHESRLGVPLWRNYDLTVSPNFVDHETGQYGCAFAIPSKGKARLKSYPSGVAADPSMFATQVITLYDGTPLVILIGPCPGVYVISIDYGGGYLNDYTVQMNDSPYFQLVKPNEDAELRRLFILKENGLLLVSGEVKYFFEYAPAGEPKTPVALDGTNSFETTSGGQSKAVFVAANVRTFEAVWDQMLFLTTDFKLFVWGYYYDNFGLAKVALGYHTRPQLLLEGVASFGQLWGGNALVWSDFSGKVYGLGYLEGLHGVNFRGGKYSTPQLVFTQRTPDEDLAYRQKRWSPIGNYKDEISFDETYPNSPRQYINEYVKVRCFNDAVTIIDRFGDLYLSPCALLVNNYQRSDAAWWYDSAYNITHYKNFSLVARGVADVYRTAGYIYYCTEVDHKLYVAAGSKASGNDYGPYHATFTNNYQNKTFTYDSRELIAGSKIQSFDHWTINEDNYPKTTWVEIPTLGGCYKLPCGRGGTREDVPNAHCIGWLDRAGWPQYKGVNWFYYYLSKKHAWNLAWEATFPYQGGTDYSQWPIIAAGTKSGASENVMTFPYYEVFISGQIKSYENIFIGDYNLIQVWSAYNAHYQDYCGLFVAGDVSYDITMNPLGHDGESWFYNCVPLSVTSFLANNYLTTY